MPELHSPSLWDLQVIGGLSLIILALILHSVRVRKSTWKNAFKEMRAPIFVLAMSLLEACGLPVALPVVYALLAYLVIKYSWLGIKSITARKKAKTENTHEVE